MKVLGVTQARVSSSRLPEKVLREVGGKSFLEIHLRRLLRVKKIDGLVVAIADEPGANKIQSICKMLSVPFVIGDVNDVLARFATASNAFPSQFIARFTSDCPLIDPEVCDLVISDFLASISDYDYSTNAVEPTWPDGMDIEIFKTEFLLRAFFEAKLKSEREHVTPYIRKIGRVKHYKGNADYSRFRLTLDTPNDLFILTQLISDLGIEGTWKDYVDYLSLNTKLSALNADEIRNAGYLKSLNEDKNVK